VSLIKRAWQMAERGVPLDVAERELRQYERTRKRKPSGLTGAEQMRRDREETAQAWGVDTTREVARFARLQRWLGHDIAPPPEDDQ
jgi:hypothetical protein